MEEQAQYNYAAGQLATIEKARRLDVTLRQNIDGQIAAAEKRVQELQAIKARLEASNLLDVRIDDMQQAMRW